MNAGWIACAFGWVAGCWCAVSLADCLVVKCVSVRNQTILRNLKRTSAPELCISDRFYSTKGRKSLLTPQHKFRITWQVVQKLGTTGFPNLWRVKIEVDREWANQPANEVPSCAATSRSTFNQSLQSQSTHSRCSPGWQRGNYPSLASYEP
jgi:hypothetical protein